jgi:hypothetical protein
MSQANASSLPAPRAAADLRDRDDRQLAELVPEHAQGRVLRSARLGCFGGVLDDLGQIDVRDEVVGVGALQHHHTGHRVGFQGAEEGDQVAYQLGPDEVHRRRVDHDTQHSRVSPGCSQRVIVVGHRLLLSAGAEGAASQLPPAVGGRG